MNCPNCGAYIKFYDLKPNCSKCGVNILYYTQQDGLVRDAKRSELEYASARIFGAKLKDAFIGGTLQIVRIAAILLTVATLIIPFTSFTFSIPLSEIKITISGIGAYNMFSDGTLMQIGNFLKSTLFADASAAIVTLIALFLVIVFAVLALFIIFVLTFIAPQLLSKAAAIVSFCAAGMGIAYFAVSLAFKALLPAREYVTLSLGFGSLVCAAALAAYGIINLKLSKREPVLKLREFDLERKELLKKVKAGEVDLDSLSLPIFETEEEKQKRIEELEEALKKEEEGKE